jgi:hypothetical protein
MQTSQNQQKGGLLFSLAKLIDEKRADFGKALSSCFVQDPWFGPLAFSLVATLLFYYPSIRNGSRDADFLYGGNGIGFYGPYLVDLKYLLPRCNFVALDFSHFNASADFFTSHLLFVACVLCNSPETKFQVAGRILIPALPSHSFFACPTATAITIELTRGLSDENLFTRDCGMGQERRLLNFCHPVPMPGSIRKTIRLSSRP